MSMWDAAQKAAFFKLRKEGRSYRQIGEAIGKSKRAVGSFAERVNENKIDSCPRPAPRCPDPAPEAGGPELPDPETLNWEPYHVNIPGWWLLLMDLHIPFHDKCTVELAISEAQKKGAAGIILNGDLLDSGEISSHVRHSDLPRYKEELRIGKQFFAWLRYKFPDIPILFKEGNHEDRLFRYIARRASALEGIEGIDLPSFLHMDEYGIDWINEKRIIQLGKLNVVHGHEFQAGGRGGVSAGPVNPARGLYLKARSVAICGHFHRTSEHHSKNIRQQIESAWSVGCACYMTPDWCRLNDWNLGFAMVELQSDGNFRVENHRVIAGRVV